MRPALENYSSYPNGPVRRPLGRSIVPSPRPPARAIIDFIAACRREGVPFKATAGLHHPLRAEYRLTYDVDSPKGMMYGFLNVFFAAALIYFGEAEETALAALQETHASAFTFD